MADAPSATATERAERRARYLAGLLWHLGTFAIINGFFWLMDLTLGEAGVQWAFWITAAWGFALAFHVLAYLIDGRQVVAHKTDEYAGKPRPGGA